MNTKRAPKVRFKGFTDAWELRKFESIAARASSISADPTLPRRYNFRYWTVEQGC